MRYIVVDLEATCWENARDRSRMEIIEIGAVEMPSSSSAPGREFARFVQPVIERQLSDFCRQLTTIRQSDVDGASGFGHVFSEFVDWIGDEPFVLCSWGGYDLTQFRADCARHEIPLPASFEQHINLKKEFARLRGIKPCGMERALSHAGLPLSGTHHRGIDDARNIAHLAVLILPQLEKSGDMAGT